MNNIRNVAIIAHVDHGKTTLVDALLRQSKTKLGKEFTDSSELIMDSNDLEKERGITIFSKNASVIWNDVKINIIDTPGHADFGGEVERVLKLADGCLLLIDAKEGPMPQTRFVLKRALELGHKIIVVINKIDKPDARIQHVLNKTFDLFLELGADEETAYFPTIYSSSKLGKAGLEPDLDKMTDISPIFDAILKYIPSPSGDPDQPLQMLITSTTYDNFKGRIATGRIYNGKITAGQDVTHINRAGQVKKCRLTSLISFEGLEKVEIKEAVAGDIVAIAGIPDITIGETIADASAGSAQALPLLDIEEPTVRMTFSVNSSPFAGKEGEFKTSRQIQERVYKELESDVALKVEDCPGGWIVSGRGELHLAILIERMRREGYEFQVSRPQVIEKKADGATLTPFERVLIEVPEEYSGIVMQKMGLRHGQMQDMNTEEGIVLLEFIISTKELFGFRSEFISDTHGMGILNASFLEYRKDPGNTFTRDRGSLIAHENGVTKLHGLIAAQGRGDLFIGPAVPVYAGQVVGQNSRGDDIRVNVCKEKQQTNHRSSGEGVSEHFNMPKALSLELALEYINDSELVEVTPKSIRVRKINLQAH
ncbi:GTP-binding protein TypA [Candidatus Daviesbacteria bacterium RIFCSPHIGHO2_12_FULL_43_11]|uniref:50S ribosomal subunit assembly factor BipA n=1 Tax=Candidatus Daviesbacteria bacterium RIFCSPHIGHO2_12_FULL_43_11 TaxID=1797780 RepID=A0A1F5K0A0_9BACT|nr:MAG: GTP-binding protein TypA [Candidatus Daviesbacteria bacterium RIFCSPHIGHO2_01_FULL_43_17]OGE34407.1 MAG: GTP-binding protein TypA [Candidatus Daviesbacteria bacterium RIFCSPHIGHO2_12_FULL_43_11]OGE70807.1 MAG: GTP-binding protein TypA [Candidatus Daviesbacteria bacterium RIFCSPLOWO2_02_FULL_43_11]